MSRRNFFTVLLTAVLVLGIAATAFADPWKGKGPWKFNGKIRSRTYEVADNATIRVDGERADLNDVEEGARVTAYLDRDDIIVSLYARNSGEDENGDLELEKLTPADGSDDVDTDTERLVARFNMEIRAIDNLDSVKSGVRVRNVTDGEYVDIDEVSIDGEELVIELEDSLEEDKTYRVTVNAGKPASISLLKLHDLREILLIRGRGAVLPRLNIGNRLADTS